uniref:Uncharacterized protein n=1 Tax=Romanomermis culicivorax TaxID=13658 RepID=A0A915HHV1_ROMCU
MTEISQYLCQKFKTYRVFPDKQTTFIQLESDLHQWSESLEFVDNAMSKDNRTMTHVIYAGTKYVKEFTECVHEEKNKEI